MDAFNLKNVSIIFMMAFQDLSRKLRLPLFSREVSNYFMTLLRQTVEHREKNYVVRNVFLQLLIQLKNNGFLEGEAADKESQKLTFNEIAAQAFIFFFAG